MKKPSVFAVLILTLISTMFVSPQLLLALKGKEGVVAKVGDKEITQAELDEASKQDLMPLAAQIYQMKKQRLDQMVQEALYQEEAKSLKKSVDDIKKSVATSDTTMSDDALEVFYDSNKARFGNKTLEQAKDEIRQLLIKQKADKVKNQFLDELKKKHAVEVYLEEPKIEIDTAGHPSRGAQDAKVTIVEFSDFQCPFCKKFTTTIDQIVKDYSKDVRHVYRNLPLPFHNQARGAAKAAACADRQGKFWQYREVLFQNNTAMDEPNLRKFAEQVGLDMVKYDDCFKDPSIDKFLDSDLDYANKVGARGTPTSFVNGVVFSGARPYEELKQIVEQKIKGA